MKTTTERATGDQKPARPQQAGTQASNEAPPLPHETDQSVESQHEDDPRGVGKQAHRDLERGLEDTDRRGGDDYQERTQNDAHANRNSQKKGGAATRRK
ncbi:MAG TPA: hypothetical protein VGL08_08005 [Paraburkholderia sp.]